MSVRSLLIIKPEGVARGLIGTILNRFEQKGFYLIASKMTMATPDKLALHYEEHFEKDYYLDIEKSMLSGPIFVFVMEGPQGTIECIRKMVGSTNPMNSDPGTIRGDFAVATGRNVCHASDSIESADREINIWFNKVDLSPNKRLNHELLYRN